MVIIGMLREWSGGSGACCMHVLGTMRVLRRVVEGDGRARGVEPLRKIFLSFRIKACVLLLIGDYETVSLRTPNPISRLDSVLRLMTWLLRRPLMTHSIP